MDRPRLPRAPRGSPQIARPVRPGRRRLGGERDAYTFRGSMNFHLLALLLLIPQDLPPDQALKRMKVADGFEVRLVASEPTIRQPLTISFDDRGRIWLIQ